MLLRTSVLAAALAGVVLIGCAGDDEDSSNDAAVDAGETGGTGGTAGPDPSGGHGGAGEAGQGGAGAEGGSAGASGAESDAGTGPDAQVPVSRFCGDALRDPIKEECDDGPGESDDSCSSGCRVVSLPVVAPVDVVEGDGGVPDPFPPRFASNGPHVAAASSDGIAVVWLEGDLDASVRVQRFDAYGGRKGAPLEVDSAPVALSVPSPAIAALPNGDYVVAWTMVTASPDIALSLIEREGIVGAPVLASTTTAGPQDEVDIVWTGSELVVAWTDVFDIRARSFDEQLTPTSSDYVVASSGAIESGVVATPFAGGVAFAWRSSDAGLEQVRVRYGDTEWWTPLAPQTGSDDRPALAAIDESQLLLMFGAVDVPSDASRVRYAILNRSAPGEVDGTPIEVQTEPYASDDTLGQRRPRAVQVGSRLYAGWENSGHAGDLLGAQVFVQEIEINARSLSVISEWQLPIGDATRMHQSNIALASSPLFPAGALIATWEDRSMTRASESPMPELMLEVRPSPLIFLP